MQVKSKSQNFPWFSISHKYRISSNKRLWRLFNVEALRGGAYYRAMFNIGRRLFVIVSLQITVNNNHYDIWDKVFRSGLSKFCGRQSLRSFKGYGLLKIFKGCLPQNLLSPPLNTLFHIILYIPELPVICIAPMFSDLPHTHFILPLD